MTDEKKTKKNDFMAVGRKLRDEINQRLKQKDYVLTVIQTGDPMFTHGDPKRSIYPKRFYKVCSLEEIPEMINFMKQPFWNHPDLEEGMSEREQDKIPFEEKKWGINSHIDITPLTKEKEEQFLKDVESGFLQSWRDISMEEVKVKEVKEVKEVKPNIIIKDGKDFLVFLTERLTSPVTVSLDTHYVSASINVQVEAFGETSDCYAEIDSISECDLTLDIEPEHIIASVASDLDFYTENISKKNIGLLCLINHAIEYCDNYPNDYDVTVEIESDSIDINLEHNGKEIVDCDGYELLGVESK